MKELLNYLPSDWEKKAKELGAMSRASGVIKSASSLLRLNMLYVTNGGSFQMAALGMYLTEGIRISKTGAYKRVKGSGEWLRWMSEELLEQEGKLLPKPEFLGERKLVLIDASDEGVKGSKQSDYRLHYAFDLFQYCCKSVEITGVKEGEQLARYEIAKDEILVADRAYCSMTGIEYVNKGGGSYLLRYRSKAFRLYDETGKVLELLPLLRELKSLEHRDIPCYYRLADGRLRPIRVVAMKKDAESIEQSRRKMKRKASKKQEKPAQAETMELNEYVLLVTNLEDSAEQILELYRARWQVERVFYRLKSLFGYGDTPSKREDTVLAWFYGKLLLAALCESVLKQASFSPDMELYAVDFIGRKFME